MGYRPNMLARALKKKSTKVIGVLITTEITNPWFAELVSAIEHALTERGYTIMLGMGNRNYEKIHQCFEIFNSGHIEGLILAPFTIDQHVEDYLDIFRSHLPIVTLTAKDNMISDSIEQDNCSACKEVVKYLYQHGHRRIGYLACPPNANNMSGLTRWRGFQEAMMELDLPVFARDILEGKCFMGHGFKLMDKLIEERPNDLPTAFFCHNDEVALEALAAIQRHGLKVPDDISLVGFDGLPQTAVSNPPLTTMDGHINEVAEMMVDTLLDASRAIIMKSKSKG